MNPDRFQKVEVASAAQLRSWLERNYTQSDSVWLVTFKKVQADKYLSREEVLDELIAFGWIDGVRSQVDEVRTMQLISPRKTKPWAKSYKLRAERLILEGKMHSAGLASVEEAKRGGGWDEMNDVDDLFVPPDLEAALDKKAPARLYFEAFPESVKRNILRWIASAKTAETRARRVNQTAMQASVNKRVDSHS
ncbi:YdeI/OmpD-associated family protein [Pontimonas sp.]|nr:YdeI/OmpD-associated family protein [Pontimonas sp.]MDA9114599.1 YdeI/OmpD-associated family protein [Pontimonas sp.]